MTCIKFGNGIVCVNPYGRLHVGNKYIMVDFHPYCGPSFYTDSAMRNLYEPVEDDPVWLVFSEWLRKYNKKKYKEEERILNEA